MPKKSELTKNTGLTDTQERLLSCADCGNPCAANRSYCLDCSSNRERNDLMRGSGLERYHLPMTFKSYDPQTESQLKAVAALMSYINEIKLKETVQAPNVVIYGPVGTGKTHLAVAVAKMLIDYCCPVEFIPGFNLLFKIKNTFDRKSYDTGLTTEQLIEKYSSIEFLIIDDMAAENITEWSREVIYMIIYNRHVRCLATIVTSNDDPVKLAMKYTDRIVSRLLEKAIVLPLDGEDYRLKK